MLLGAPGPASYFLCQTNNLGTYLSIHSPDFVRRWLKLRSVGLDFADDCSACVLLLFFVVLERTIVWPSSVPLQLAELH